MPPRRTNINAPEDEVRPTLGMRTRNRAHTSEPVPTPGVPPVPTSLSRSPHTNVNRSPTTQRDISNAEFRQSIHMLTQLVDNQANIQYTIGWSDNSESISSQKMAWLRKLYKEREPYIAKSPRTAYLNYRDLDFGINQEDYSYSKAKMWGEKYFNGNFERLAKVKSKVDPKNFFKHEQSIPPYSY
ncbi:hypothetical protein P3S68_017373 [Capsicum galapagoense]